MRKYNEWNKYLVIYKKYSDKDRLWDLFNSDYVYGTYDFNKSELLSELRKDEFIKPFDVIEIINVIKL